MRTRTILIWALSLSMFNPLVVVGKAAYATKKNAVQQAEIIAIVEVTKVEPRVTKGVGWTYEQVAHAKPESVLKGSLPHPVKLYGKENFICAQARFTPGKFLVFLDRDGELLTGANWHLSSMAIKGQQVEWFENDKSISLRKAPLKEVLLEVKSILDKEWPVLVHTASASRSPTRLLLAHWADGTTLRENEEGKLEVGKAAHPRPWRMWKGLREAKFFKIAREHYIVPDSSYETLYVSQGSESAIHSWHGVLTRGFGGDIETDMEYRAFVEMWQCSERSLSELVLSDVQPVEAAAVEGSFRGYNLKDPTQTPWLNHRDWKQKISAKH